MSLIDVTDANFDREVNTDGDALVVFSAPNWCAPCRAIHPKLVELSQRYGGRLRVLIVDHDKSPRAVAKNRVVGVPAPFFVQARNGKVVSSTRIDPPNAAGVDAFVRQVFR